MFQVVKLFNVVVCLFLLKQKVINFPLLKRILTKWRSFTTLFFFRFIKFISFLILVFYDFYQIYIKFVFLLTNSIPLHRVLFKRIMHERFKVFFFCFDSI